MEKVIAYDTQIYKKQARGGISRYFTLLVDNISSFSGLTKAPFRKNLFGSVDSLFDIIHATYYLGTPYSLSSGQLLVSTLHDMIPEKYPEFFFASSVRSPHLNKRTWLNRSDLVISVSSSSADDLAFFYPETSSRIVTIHHGTSMGMFQPCPVLELRNKPFYLYVGKRQGYKNGMLILRILAHLKCGGQLSPDFPRVVFAGGEHLSRAERKLIAEHSLHPYLYFCGPTDSELSWLYRNSQAVLVPSIAEGFSFPVVEAMACNAPVIASDIEVHREVGGAFATVLSPFNLHLWSDCLLGNGYSSPLASTGPLLYEKLVNYYSIKRFVSDHALAYLA